MLGLNYSQCISRGYSLLDPTGRPQLPQGEDRSPRRVVPGEAESQATHSLRCTPHSLRWPNDAEADVGAPGADIIHGAAG